MILGDFSSIRKGTPNMHSRTSGIYYTTAQYSHSSTYRLVACHCYHYSFRRVCEIAFLAFLRVEEKLIMPIQPTSLLIFAPLAC